MIDRTEETPGPTMRDVLLAAKDRIAPFIPKGMDAEEVLQLCYIAVKRNPALMKCTSESIVQAVVTILGWDLVIGQTAFLIPYKNKAGVLICTPVAYYAGLAQLMVKSGAVRHVEARCVYENEPFRCVFGMEPVLEHQRYADVASRGKMKGAYCILTLPGYVKVFEYIPIADIEVIRKEYSRQWGPDKVEECPAWYAEKTVVRKMAKLAVKDARMAKVLRVIDEDAAIELESARDVAEAIVAPAPASVPAQRALTEGPAKPIPVPGVASDPALVSAKRQGATAPPAGATQEGDVIPDGTGDPKVVGEPTCPKCESRMWDNRLTKRNPKAPDFKCRDRSCDGVIWPDKEPARAAARATTGREQPPHPADDPDQDEIPF